MKKSVVIFFLLFSFKLLSQDTTRQKLFVSGYVSEMSQTMIDSIGGQWLMDGQIHNRLKINYYPASNFSTDIEIRNRLIYGESVFYNPDYASYVDQDRGFVDMSYNISTGDFYVLNTTIDRAYLKFEKGKFVATLGRQRINWGKTFVWNPNDLFNNYSFFDFDYAEKPGSDAFDLQFYPNYSSIIEFATKIDRDTNLTTAVRYGFNAFNYDFQLLVGYYQSSDFAIGTGWSGNIWNVTFRGEATYLQPQNSFFDTTGVFVATAGFDHMFANGLTVFAEYLYNQTPMQLASLNFYQVNQAPQSVKNLSFARHNFVAQISYPISPIINFSLSGMYMHNINIVFLSPDFDFSLNQNFDLSIINQFFYIKIINPQSLLKEKKLLTFVFLRLKFDF